MGQVEMAARHAIAPFWYYMFELYLPERKKQAASTSPPMRRSAPPIRFCSPQRPDGMDDKIWFAEHCHEMGVRAVPVLMHFSRR
jgi:hypothetical protein